MNNLLELISKSPSKYHLVRTIEETLQKKGFEYLEQKNPWKIVSKKDYYTIINGSTLIAFRVGEEYTFNIACAHTDFPTFKLKPNFENGNQLSIESYGGAINYSWFDRPLSIAGRIFDMTNQEKLVDFEKDLLIIPSIPIHFASGINKGIELKPKNMNPIVINEMENIECLAHDLYLYNRDRGRIVGNHIIAPQLDDISCVYAICEAFLKERSNNISVMALFDSEEIGSTTMQGANSTILRDILERINYSLNKTVEDFNIALAKSINCSCDNAHAYNPNFKEVYDEKNAVFINKGIVIKYNANHNYATDAKISSILKKALRENEIPYQEFANHTDLRGGTTLGPIITKTVPIKTIDIGLPQYAMHSANETIGKDDLESLIKTLNIFYIKIRE